MKIAVAGSSGTVGRHVLAHAEAAGHEVVPLSRGTGVDLLSGEGLGAQLAGVDAVVDCLGTAALSRRTAERFFATTTGVLLRGEREAGVPHHVVLSIAGIDEADSGYYAAKRHQERTALASGQAVTILRSTQFHEFAAQVLDRGRLGPVALVPRVTCAPVAASEVGQWLVELATAPAGNERLEVRGPETLQLVDMARALTGSRVAGVRLPGAMGRGMRSGVLVPREPWRVGTQTFAEWCEDRGSRRTGEN